MTGTPDLGRELAEAFTEGRAPSFRLAGIPQWVKAIDAEISKGRHDIAGYAVRSLRREEPELEWAGTMDDVLARTAALPAGALFKDDVTRDVQVMPCPDATTAIICFGDVNHKFGMAMGVMQRWFARFNAHFIYVRDFQKLFYLNGIRSLGPRPVSVASLREIAHGLGAKRILCMGNSGGGYGALRYGILLGAEAVLSFAGPVTLEPGFNPQRLNVTSRLRRKFPDEPLDNRTLFVAANRKPRLIIAYGEQHWDDRLQAEHMAGLPNVQLVPLAGHSKHGAILPLIRSGGLEGLLDNFFSERPSPAHITSKSAGNPRPTGIA